MLNLTLPSVVFTILTFFYLITIIHFMAEKPKGSDLYSDHPYPAYTIPGFGLP